jgi:2-keto-4-pentenoate hydratase/2-oxohepta-3-ene-1,7-dioic acid hydratase in catechol pathway
MRLATAIMDGDPRLLLNVEEGFVDVAGSLPDLGTVTDVGALFAAGPMAVDAVRGLLTESATFPHDGVTLAPPVLAPSKIVCIGLNYQRHATESGVPVPAEPVIFSKYPSTLVGHKAPILCSPLSDQLDYEAELGVVIGRRAHAVSRAEASSVIGGYVNANDVTARDLQHGLPGGQWTFGKSLDSFCPLGPYVVTPDETGPWREIRIQCWVNGELRQDEGCADMIFGVEELIEYVSRGITLLPGDILLTGTPSGIAMAFSPPKWLRHGDVVEVELTGLGRLTSPVL